MGKGRGKSKERCRLSQVHGLEECDRVPGKHDLLRGFSPVQEVVRRKVTMVMMT